VSERGARRFSQAISEGDGISVVADVREASAAQAAADEGAEAIVVHEAVAALREATELPILWFGDGAPDEAASAGADAYVVRATDERAAELHAEAVELGLESVIRVHSDEELEDVLERLDPEIFLLGGEPDDDAWEHTFDLLSSVPAGKLAIAALERPSRDRILELERAGVDAVIVGAGDVAGLVGEAPPQV
jgi:indole-3-glycerol phosphate synthase